MASDVIVLTREMPNTVAVLDGLGAAGEELRVNLPGRAGVIQLCDDVGRVLLSVDAPVRIEAVEEAERLLGERAAELPPPLWRVRVRASGRDDADELARRFARALVRQLGGLVVEDGVRT